MKKFLVAAWFVLTLALAFSPGPVLADSDDSRTFVLSNERGPANEGGLIDMLIAAGHGDDNLYEVLQLLAADPASGIPADFVASVGNNLPGSDVFTAALSNFAGLNNPVCINADGTLKINALFGRDYDGDTGYVTNKVHYPGIALANFTMATSPTYYINAGSGGGSTPINYQAIGIAWSDDASENGTELSGKWPVFCCCSGCLKSKICIGVLKIDNIGDKKAGRFAVSYYLSDNGTDLGALIRKKTISGIRAGRSYYNYFGYNSRTSLSGKYIIAVIDSDNQINEKDENNNRAVRLIP